MFEAHQKYLEELAYYYWEQDGRPNGEEYVHTWCGRIKIKEIHWLMAEVSLQEDFEIFKYLDNINSNDPALEHSQE